MEALLDADLVNKGYTSLGTFDDWQNKSKFKDLPIVLEVDKGYTLGNEIAGDVGIPNDILSLGNNDIWCKHFLNVVTETVIHSDVFVSEKTFKPIVLMQPFVLAAPPGCLNYLKSYGFKTFDNWWDESYDTIEDPSERMAAVADIVNWIPSQNLEKLRMEMAGVLEHNYRHFYENIPAICLQELRTLLS